MCSFFINGRDWRSLSLRTLMRLCVLNSGNYCVLHRRRYYLVRFKEIDKPKFHRMQLSLLVMQFNTWMILQPPLAPD